VKEKLRTSRKKWRKETINDFKERDGYWIGPEGIIKVVEECVYKL
jgi:hypothetical protein